MLHCHSAKKTADPQSARALLTQEVEDLLESWATALAFKVIWYDEAITYLRGICSYIARDNPEAGSSRTGLSVINEKHPFPLLLQAALRRRRGHNSSHVCA